MKQFAFLLPLALAACADFGLQIEPVPGASETDAVLTDGPPPPPENARTVEDFDTTTEAERIAAASPSSGGRLLGSTVASLGDATQPGFWIETALAQAPGPGRLVYPVNGKSVEVELRPIESGSSRVSLAALRLLEAPLTELPTIEVYAQ